MEAAGKIPSPSKSLNVGIVGGGIAGLYAGLLLQSNGHRVRVFEGTDRVGGRVYTHYFTQEEDQYFEAGAMRLPYSRFHKYTFDLIAWVQQFELPQDREVDLIRYVLSASGNRFLVNGHLSTRGVKPLSVTPKSIGWDTVPDEFKDKSAEELLKSAVGGLIKEFDLENNFDEGFQKLVENFDNFSFRFYLLSVMGWPTTVIDFVETVASQTNQFALSVTEMVMQNMDFDTEDWYTIKYGMNRLPSALSWLLGYKNITYGARVTGIQKTNDKVKIIAVGNNGRIEATFDKVILAIPPAALKMIANRPVWKVPKEVAIRSMHFEALFKMGLRFKNRFWERVTPTPTAGGQSTTDLPIRWAVYPSNGIVTQTAKSKQGPGVLLVYAWMTDATTWLPLSAMERRSLALFCLARLYKDAKDPDTGEQVNVYDLLMSTADAVWSAATSTGDAMFLPGQFAAHFEAAREPEDNIFFAGEHLSRHHTWVTGACESAHKAVRDLLGDPSLPPLGPIIYPEQAYHLPHRPDTIFHPTGPPRKDELDRGAPLLPTILYSNLTTAGPRTLPQRSLYTLAVIQVVPLGVTSRPSPDPAVSIKHEHP